MVSRFSGKKIKIRGGEDYTISSDCPRDNNTIGINELNSSASYENTNASYRVSNPKIDLFNR